MLMTLYSTGMRRAELCQLKVDGHRQRAHDDSHPAGQGRPRPRRAAEPEAAGDPAGVLALDEAEDVSVSRHREGLAGRRADHRQGAVGSLPGSGAAGRHHQARLARTSCGTASPLTCSKPAPTCARSRCCWATPNSSTPPSTCIFPSASDGRRPTRWTRLASPARTGEALAEAAKDDEPATLRGGRYHSRNTATASSRRTDPG